MEAKDKPADALASHAGDLQSSGGGTAGVQLHTPPELEEELASLRAKMSGKMSDVLSIQAEPKRSGGTKGVGTVGTAARLTDARLARRSLLVNRCLAVVGYQEKAGLVLCTDEVKVTM